ncbi:CaiB/BaiF CoA transferase family protein [Piscinibacter sakaiensis]|uniref:L-carnitine dehydratase/bile acid-inducible protein F n=1 Tax=Piscinibacter sakaiensis TaxID=1547922 RepID=A0A0K8NVD9_PISS1|nr:CoA transferase [Piscinibacter sakaiensis]GAP34361.1 L-carnitine dehydratase/bile acid-inducible protein F [Piscinibacter sakaiensis]
MAEPDPRPAPQGPRPLDGILVVALEQAVAAPYCSSRLADAGARVIKVERREGDFARGYDRAVHGESSYWVWINRGKESIALDVKQPGDLAVLQRMVARADVFLQNLAPGAAERLGLGSAALRQRHPRLVTCDISGYGDDGRLFGLKAYDLLVQAESGLVSVSGAPGEWGRIGVSLCDITAGMNALIGIQQALMQRERTGQGSAVKVSLFGSAAELMSVPYLQARYGGKAPERVGLRHPTIAPYGAFTCADGRDIVISIQNEREWADFCRSVLQRPDLLEDPRCAGNAARVTHRDFVDGSVAEVFGSLPSAIVLDRLAEAQTAFGNVNSVHDLIEHPQLRTRRMPVDGRMVEVPAAPWGVDWDPETFAPAPGLDAHGRALRAEFGAPEAAANEAATAPARAHAGA